MAAPHNAREEVLAVLRQLAAGRWAAGEIEQLTGRATHFEGALRRLMNAVGALTDAEDRLSCIDAGPERDELECAYAWAAAVFLRMSSTAPAAAATPSSVSARPTDTAAAAAGASLIAELRADVTLVPIGTGAYAERTRPLSARAADEIERLNRLFSQTVREIDSCGCEWETDEDGERIAALCRAHQRLLETLG